MHEETLFAEALAKKGAARAAFLDEQCKGDVEVRQRLEALLRAHDNPDPFLEAPAPVAGATLDMPMREGPGTVIGTFKLLQQIGEGGMGTVFMAEQTQPVQRKVALKITKAGMDSRQVVARFEAERQALALMDHPNIAHVFDGGATESGRPYFVMELVRGVPITEYCDDHRIGLPERLELFVSVCRAVQHAHQKGIIHRDIKPSNVMVTPHDGVPVAKVIDFGIAKATGPRLTDKTLFTNFAQMIGTPLYMSPEQASLSGLDVDTRSDIYSLGVLLYELLTGTTPFDKSRFKEADYDEIRRIIREEDPPRPSTRVSTLGQAATTMSAQRKSDPKRLSQLFRGELDWIVMKCLEKDRSRRYETANALAQDIERYLADEPVLARPPSAAYRLRKFVQRNKGPVVAAALVFLALVAGVIGVSLSLIEAKRQEEIALTAAADEKKARLDEAEQRRRTADALVQLTAEQKKTKLALAAQTSARKRTWEALNTLTDDFMGQVFGKQARLGEAEKDFLRKMLGFYQAFAAEQGESEEARWVAADGQYRVARLRAFLGEKTQAVVGYREAIRRLEALVPLFPGRPAHRQLLALGHNNLGILLRELGEWSAAEMHYREALAIWKQFAADLPSAVAAFRADVASCRHNLSVLLSDLGKRSEAETVLREALAIQEKLVEEFPNIQGHRQDLALSYSTLGSLLGESGKLAAAEAVFTKALTLRQKLADRFPDVPIYRQDLAAGYHSQGFVLRQLGKRAEANKSYRQALTIQDELAGKFPTVPGYRHDLAATHDSLGRLLRDVSKRADAETAHRRALAIRQKLVDDFAEVPAYRQELAGSHARMGSLLGESGKPADGEAAIREALAIQAKLAADFPDVPLYRKNLADSHSSLGHLLSEWRKWTGADHAHHQALAILEKLADKFPDVPAYRRGLALSHNNLGIVLHRQGKLPEAEAAYRKALAIQEKLAGDLADMPSYRTLFAASSVNFGHLVRDQGRPQDALAWYAKAIPLLEANLAEDARLTRDRLFLRNAHWERAQALTALKRDAEALKDWDRVVALEQALEGPAESWFRLERALTRARLGDHVQAVAEADQLTDADKISGGMLYNAACVHGVSMRAVKDDKSLQEKYAKQAIALLRRAHAAGYFRNAKVIEHLHQDDDLAALRERADFKELVADLKGNQEKK